MRPLFLSALLCVWGATSATADLSAATGGQIARMAAVARNGCLRHFPTYSTIAGSLTSKRYVRDSMGVWRDEASYVIVDQSGSDLCEIVMVYPVRTEQVSDAVQTALPGAPVAFGTIARKGVRLTASFQGGGPRGHLQTAQSHGRPAQIKVTAEV